MPQRTSDDNHNDYVRFTPSTGTRGRSLGQPGNVDTEQAVETAFDQNDAWNEKWLANESTQTTDSTMGKAPYTKVSALAYCLGVEAALKKFGAYSSHADSHWMEQLDPRAKQKEFSPRRDKPKDLETDEAVDKAFSQLDSQGGTDHTIIESVPDDVQFPTV